jgi:hypothetical protein
MGRRRTNLAWLIAVIAGIFMVVPTLASAQEQGSTAEPTLTDEVTADDSTTTEAPPAETPPAEPTTDPVVPVEPTEPAPVEPADATKAPEPAASEPVSAPAPAEAAAPAEPAEVAAAEAKATSTPGNGGSGRAAAATRVGSDSGDLRATVKTGDSKPGCAARGGANEIHNGFPDDGSCDTSIGGLTVATEGDEISDLELTLNGNTVTFDLWLSDSDGEGGPDTVNYVILSGGPASGAFYVKGGPPHNQCTFTNVATGAGGSCSTALNPNSGKLYGFSHLDVCLGENPPPPPPPDEFTPPEEEVTPPPPDDEVLTEDEREQRDEQREEEQREELEELLESAPPVPTAVTPAPEEALPFTGLDTGWLVLMSLGLLGSGFLLRRTVS